MCLFFLCSCYYFRKSYFLSLIVQLVQSLNSHLDVPGFYHSLRLLHSFCRQACFKRYYGQLHGSLSTVRLCFHLFFSVFSDFCFLISMSSILLSLTSFGREANLPCSVDALISLCLTEEHWMSFVLLKCLSVLINFTHV